MRSITRSIKKTDLVWRYGLNLVPTVDYKIHKHRLTGVERNIIDKLNSDGVVITSVEELFDNDSEFLSLDAATRSLLENRKQEIDGLKSMVNDPAIGHKTFNLEMLGSELVFDSESIFARFALNNRLLNIANAYFQMYAKLRYYNVWKTFASQGSARESQLWHFDREDNYILKLFLYLEDVDEGAGPFTYAQGTHRKGRFRFIKPEFFMEGNVRRTTDEQMNAVFPKEKWKKGTGKKGTIIFADTRGFHKGGEARIKDRLMYTCMYTSKASESKELLKVPSNIDTSTLTSEQLRNLGIK
ncbi:MAG: phytanoyl-CoA dioxygenase family protein [Chloracidobacterium sp.]|nr:phytanoyl-CoA dioxygenase family protein [Chloracidobacterium sp.]